VGCPERYSGRGNRSNTSSDIRQSAIYRAKGRAHGKTSRDQDYLLDSPSPMDLRRGQPAADGCGAMIGDRKFDAIGALSGYGGME
jgi:hypothetical protein